MYRAALVNLTTDLVESIIIVNSFDDVPPAGYTLAAIPMIEEVYFVDDEEKTLYNILSELEIGYEPKKRTVEFPIVFGKTKWSVDKGFYE